MNPKRTPVDVRIAAVSTDLDLCAGTAPASMADVLNKLALLLKDPRLGSDTKARVPIVRACGHLAAGASDASLRTALVDILLAQTPTSAAEDLHFAVGESLCLALSGANAAVAKALLFSPSSTLADLRRNRELSAGLPGGPSDTATGTFAEASAELKQKILTGAVDKAASGTADERAGAAVWLVLLLVFCGEDRDVVEGLSRLQGALVVLLASDTRDLVQVGATSVPVAVQRSCGGLSTCTECMRITPGHRFMRTALLGHAAARCFRAAHCLCHLAPVAGVLRREETAAWNYG